MICTLHSVSPAAAAHPAPSTPDGRPWDAAPQQGKDEHLQDVQEEEVNFKHAMANDPIVGVELTISDENGPGARNPYL